MKNLTQKTKNCNSLVLPCKFFGDTPNTPSAETVSSKSSESEQICSNESIKLREKGIVLYPNQTTPQIKPIKKFNRPTAHSTASIDRFTLKSTKIIDDMEVELTRRRHQHLNSELEGLQSDLKLEQQKAKIMSKRENGQSNRLFLIQFYLIFGVVAFFMGWMAGRFHFLTSKNRIK